MAPANESLQQREPAIHPASMIFPMMDSAGLKKLKADIRKHGQLEPVVFWRQQLLDGRNRYKACQELGITASERELDENADPIDYVLSANLHRRHLSESQRAFAAAQVKKLLEPEAIKRKAIGQKSGGKTAGRGRAKQAADSSTANLQSSNGKPKESAAQAASLLNVSTRAVYQAGAVHKHGSKELQDAVQQGEVAVSRAAAVAISTPRSEQLTVAKSKPATDPKSPFEELQHWWGRADEAARIRFRLWIDGKSKGDADPAGCPESRRKSGSLSNSHKARVSKILLQELENGPVDRCKVVSEVLREVPPDALHRYHLSARTRKTPKDKRDQVNDRPTDKASGAGYLVTDVADQLRRAGVLRLTQGNKGRRYEALMQEAAK